jgi:hypothetical protein
MENFRFLAPVDSLQNTKLPDLSKVNQKFGGLSLYEYVIRVICYWSVDRNHWVAISLNLDLYDPSEPWLPIFPQENEPSLAVQLKELISRDYIILDSNWITPTPQLCEYLESACSI